MKKNVEKIIMFTPSELAKMLLVTLFTLALSACGGSNDVESGAVLLTCDVPMIPDATGNSCVAPPPIACEAPTVPDALNEKCEVGVDPNAPVPVYFPAENEAVLYFNRAATGANNEPDDPAYVGYRVHSWNDATCGAYLAPYETVSWDDGVEYDGIDPVYGAYWIVPLKEDHNECGNFIIHIGTDDAGKALGGNSKMPLMQDDEIYQRMNFTFDGESSVFEYPVVSLGKQPLAIDGFAAHWLDANTFTWNADFNVISTVKLHHSATAGIEADEDDNINGTQVELITTELSDEQKAAAPLVADWPALMGDWSADEAKAMLKNQLVLVGYDADGIAIAATYVQADLVLDELFTKGENDADEATLGLTYQGDAASVSVWAPTAQSVNLKVFDADKNDIATHAMTEDVMTGIWSYSGEGTGDASLNRQFYRFEISVYHPQNKAIELLEVTDPYSVSLSTNGMYSQFVNLTDTDLQPDGWDGHTVVAAGNYEDAVIYEGHIRDFSARDESTSEANRGKYMAFTEIGSAPMMHLQTLADNGLNYFHMLPANDIASINEDAGDDGKDIVDLTDTVADLCALNSNAPVCGVESDSATLQSILEGYSSYTNDAANLTKAMQGTDSFNWGYDPKHFNVPDGSYASNPDGITRIIEMRAMIQALHETGLRVVLDVVYNHTNSSGLWDNSVFDKIVPGYYHSRDIETGKVLQSTCCNDTALEHRMMDKFMVDSLLQWTEQYKFDGFRFDIMSQGSKDQMLAARSAVQVIDEDNHFYGEGWGKDDRGFERADQVNMAGTEIATFNDRIRDSIRSAELFSNNSSEDGPFIQQDLVKYGLAGSLTDYVLKSFKGVDTLGSSASWNMYAKDPADVINYISKHDNETLWDMLQLNLDFDRSMDERVRAQNLSQSIVLLSQGIPFLQMGGDFLRSNSLDGNSYDAGDWYNLVDFTFNTNNWNMGLPLEKRGRNDDDLVSLAASPYTSVAMSEMMFASDVFNEFLNIRTSSPLFKLTTADDIINRVGFHNIGKGQTQGLIVMSIDDGTDLADLDTNYDAVVVVVNGTSNEQSHTIATAAGFSLHPVLIASVDGAVSSANFTAGENEGTFTVPALTTAVFVKAQGELQSIGLSAYATAGAPDVVPYGDTEVFVRGEMNGWGEVDAFNYIGNGVYQVTIELSAGDYSFKLADALWEAVNLGAPAASNVVIESESFTLLPYSNDNLFISIAIDGTYIFELDASDTATPILHIRNEEPFVGTTAFIRGEMNSWSEDNPLTYIGGGKYQTTFNVTAGTYTFKVASTDWSTIDMGAPSDDDEVLEGEEQLLSSGGGNLSMTFDETGNYTFVFDASNLDEPILSVYAAEMFGATTAFIRGTINGWSEDDPLTYQGNSSYSAEISIAAGDYTFKVASTDWSTINLGANENAVIDLDRPYSLVSDSQTNISLSIAETGIYIFTVAGPNPDEPTVKVVKKP